MIHRGQAVHANQQICPSPASWLWLTSVLPKLSLKYHFLDELYLILLLNYCSLVLSHTRSQ